MLERAFIFSIYLVTLYLLFINSNSNSTGSELVWATRTGKEKITAIAHETDYSSLPPSLRRRSKPSEDRSINRRFVGTTDGRIIILDVSSGYEVAIHQVCGQSFLLKLT